ESEIPDENEIPGRRRRSPALLLFGWTCARDGLAHAAGLALSLSHRLDCASSARTATPELVQRRTGNEARASSRATKLLTAITTITAATMSSGVFSHNSKAVFHPDQSMVAPSY